MGFSPIFKVDSVSLQKSFTTHPNFVPSQEIPSQEIARLFQREQDVGAMRYMVAVLLLSCGLSAQSADQPGIQYATYTLLLVPQKGEGFMVAIDK
jgi:hypothetical protein